MLRIRTTISALTVATAMVLAGMGSAPAQAGRMSSTSASSGSAEGIGAAAGAAGLPATAAAADGYLYVWDGRNFTGASCRWFGDDGDYRYNSNGCGNWNDRVSSAWNNGYANAYPDVL